MNQFDEIILDDRALDDIANFIVAYCNTQKGIMDDYKKKMNSLSSEWRDDETIGKVLQEINTLTNSVDKIMEAIRYKYPQYFKKQAEMIRARTKPNF